jgi:hypothetical protein
VRESRFNDSRFIVRSPVAAVADRGPVLSCSLVARLLRFLTSDFRPDLWRLQRGLVVQLSVISYGLIIENR